MPLSNRSRVLLLAALFVGLWVALAAGAFLSADSQQASSGHEEAVHEVHDVSQTATDVKGDQPKRALPFMEAVPTFDVSDPRKLIGFSENVFTGRVERKVSEVPLKSTIPASEGVPQVQFEVTVGKTIKSGGTNPVAEDGQTVVDQMGGTDPETGETYRIETETNGEHYSDTILEPGKEYLFATRYDRVRGFHTITAQPHGNVLLTGNPEGEAALELYERAAKDQVKPLDFPSGDEPQAGEVRLRSGPTRNRPS